MPLSLPTILFTLFISLVAAKKECPSTEDIGWSYTSNREMSIRGGPYLEITQLNHGDPVEGICLYFLVSDYGDHKELRVLLDPHEGVSNCEKETGLFIAQGRLPEMAGGPGILAYLTHGLPRSRTDGNYVQHTSLLEWENTCEKAELETVDDRDVLIEACNELKRRLGEAMIRNWEETAEDYGLLNLRITLSNMLFRERRPGPYTAYSALHAGSWDRYIKVQEESMRESILSPYFQLMAYNILDPISAEEGLSLSVQQATTLITSNARWVKICPKPSSVSSPRNEFL